VCVTLFSELVTVIDLFTVGLPSCFYFILFIYDTFVHNAKLFCTTYLANLSMPFCQQVYFGTNSISRAEEAGARFLGDSLNTELFATVLMKRG
jgi:hypothetical protein